MKTKNIKRFLSENFQFLEVKFSIYLNRRVFVMNIEKTNATYERTDTQTKKKCNRGIALERSVGKLPGAQTTFICAILQP